MRGTGTRCRRRCAGVLLTTLVAVSCASGDDSSAGPATVRTTERPTTASSASSASSATTASPGTAPSSGSTVWAEIAASLAAEFDPTSANLCNRGAVPACVGAVIAEMTRRYGPLVDVCDHNALFALTYAVMTTVIGEATVKPGDVEDPEFLAHFDAVFAQKYFLARDLWAAGREDEVPQVWRVTFDASDRRLVSTIGDVLLGMNAHISRDLAYTVAETIRVEDGARHRDYNHVNDLMATAQPRVIELLRATMDPTITTLEVAGPAGTVSFVTAVTVWREEAYRNGRRLADATTNAQRDLVVAEIEAAATARAVLIQTLTTNLPVIGDTTGRDDRCR